MSNYSPPPPQPRSSGGGTVIVVVLLILAVAGVGLLVCGGLGFLFFMAQVRTEHSEDWNDMQGPVAETVTASPAARLDPMQDRVEWVFPSSPEGASGKLHKIDSLNWVETRSDGITYQFSETARTPEFVDLFDSTRGLYVRLYPDRMEWRRDGSEWGRGQDGSWSAMPMTP